ncbi:MAG: hypothetical protein LUH58_00290 [Lachnospiraceae bacterium]|nr:hypothetical protein [Lachnospiraceae bacterium]
MTNRGSFSMKDYEQMIAKKRKEREDKKVREEAATASSSSGQGLDEHPHHDADRPEVVEY